VQIHIQVGKDEQMKDIIDL